VATPGSIEAPADIPVTERRCGDGSRKGRAVGYASQAA
jgi:hypothetical protein